MRLVAVNNVIILKKDRSYIKDDPSLTSDINYKSETLQEIPAPFTGVIDSIGIEHDDYKIGQHVAFDDMGGVYIEWGDDIEYVVITPEMVLGILD